MKESNKEAVHGTRNGNRHKIKSNLKSVLTENTNEFCTSTTLHGLKYVVDKQLNPFERIFFALSFVVVVVISFFFISNVYSKWSSTPVILSLNPVPTAITNEPFPAVTICNLNLAVKSKVQQYKNDSIEYAMLQTICHREVNMTIAKTMNDWNMLEDFILKISQPCTQLLISCRFGAVKYNCKDIFRPIVTDCGLCCVFNMIHPKFMYIPNVTNILNVSYSDGSVPVDWDPEHGYPKNLPRRFYPRPAAGTGEYLGFSIILNLDANQYYCSSSNGMGFKIFLHSPTETPHVKDVGLFIAPGTENKLRIKPEKFETDFKLRSMHKRYRQCLFDSEGDLVYFAYYTKRNCEMECLTSTIMEKCGCVSHYMPKMYTNGSICGIQHMSCVEKHRRSSLLSDADSDDCHDRCWPSCFDLTFDPDLFSIPISHNGFSVEEEVVQNMSTAYASRNIAIAHMFFKENTFRSSKQTEFIGMTDFLSSTGGLMGLFMGFSFISLAEFIYYAFMRPFYNLRRIDRVVVVQNNTRVSRGSLAANRQQANQSLQQRYRSFYGANHPQNAKPHVFTTGSASREYYGLDVNV